MDKAQALHAFWSSFGIPAYDENCVPDDAQMPYITYEVQTDSLEANLSISASLWYRSLSWEAITKKADEIALYIVNMYPPAVKIDTGRMYVTKGSPFAQRMAEPSDKYIRRMVLNINVEFFTSY